MSTFTVVIAEAPYGQERPYTALRFAMAAINAGIVMNGPTPIIVDMFSAVACKSPNCRCNTGPLADESAAPGLVSAVITGRLA